jgi:predicted DNA-binding transcriptional regulator AlpA
MPADLTDYGDQDDEPANSPFENEQRSNLPVFLTSVEVAQLLRMSPRSLEKMRLEQRGPPYIRLGHSFRSKVIYRLADVEAWINLHTNPK